MNIISNILYWISTGLLVPVIVLLIVFFVRSLILIGGFFGRYLATRRTERFLAPKIEALTTDGLEEFAASLPERSRVPVIVTLRRMFASADSPARIELLVSQYEIEADRSLSLPRTLTKMGPILGLMGTLIPMGPALVGLATGDIASMAYNMQVAFATTVVGLVVSAIGFVTQQTVERWDVRNLAILDYVARLINEKNSKG